MTLPELYELQAGNGSASEKARALLEQTHWFTVNAEFDPKTGEALPQALSAFLARIGQPTERKAHHDRLWRITEHARPSVERLFRALTESPRREHALLPVRAVRELDANSFIKLCSRPGRNIREKLAGKPHLHAVRRFQSVNLPENRLLKAFVTRLAEMLALRQDLLGEPEDGLMPKIQSWLSSDEADEIAGWDNLPPNNTLLAHRDYRTIWDAWRRLQTLDEDITRDFSQLEVRSRTMGLWKEYGRMHADGTHRFAEMPVLFDYEKFEIRPWVAEKSGEIPRLPAHAVKKAPQRIARATTTKEVHDPVCVDPADLRPRYATTKTPSRNLQDAYLWQEWKNKDEAVEIELFNADVFHLHPDATPVSLPDLLYSKADTGNHHERAARAFAGKLHSRFRNPTLLWLVPDFLNDFNLETIRRNLNACFSQAEPLPRSVAAVFERVDHAKIKNDGYAIAVVDTIGGHTCVTKLVARFHDELKKRLPKTNGFYWERCPPAILPGGGPERAQQRKYDIITVDSKGCWEEAVSPDRPPFFDPSALESDPRIGEFNYCINLSESPVTGGIRLHGLQQHAGNIPLWRDRIPELSIKVMRAGRYQRFSLVSRGTTVKPIRGQPVPIPICEQFTLPAGKQFYQFPLFQGENAEALGFSARLESPDLPLKTAAVCTLNLTFEYGADEPYKLIFEPIDKSFPAVRATWKRTEEIIIDDAPAPQYPEPSSWEKLRHWKDAQGQTVDLLAWLPDALTRLDELIPKRSAVTITSRWRRKTDSNGKAYWFAFATTEQGTCYCSSKSIINPTGEDPNTYFPAGAKLFGNVRSTSAGLSAFDISTTENIDPSREDRQKLVLFREKSLQNRMSVIWADNRSLRDADAPFEFKQKFNQLILSLSRRLPEEVFASKMLFLLACLHKDTTDECVRWITAQVEHGNIRNPRAIGFALGDVSEDWQKRIFRSLASKPNASAISVFAHAIWRERHFIDRFSTPELMRTLDGLSQRLAKINTMKPNGREMSDPHTRRDWTRATCESLELLLGLLRTRASTNPEIKMVLQPHQKITKELARQVERVTEIIAESKVQLFSRVQLNIQKTPGDRTPDLLYALRLYLTGEDGASAIHITSISDNDSD